MALWQIRATVDDRPGFLAVLAASLALRSVNILAVQVHTTELGAVDDFLVDAPDKLTEADLLAAVEQGRGRDAWAARARAQGLVDPPTRALALAGRVARDPDALAEVLRHLLGSDAVVWRPAPGSARFGYEGAVMRLPDLHGGAFEVSRRAPAFTPAEFARAQALIDLAGAAAGQAAARASLLLTDGTELVVRPAVPDDIPALLAMHGRCSPATIRRRYLGSARPSVAHLARLVDPVRCTAMVAEVAGGAERIVALAELVPEGLQAVAAVLVEDDWQRRGIGTALGRRLAVAAERAGHAALLAHTTVENAPALRLLRRLAAVTADIDGSAVTADIDGSAVTLTLPLDLREVPATVPRIEVEPGSG
ncbi:MAG TPA: GNAT family N-acetyltransferase [Pilimelia sp.]|nr:GNAT family N-acetyltransferase [Pilimelia sp.]